MRQKHQPHPAEYALNSRKRRLDCNFRKPAPAVIRKLQKTALQRGIQPRARWGGVGAVSSDFACYNCPMLEIVLIAHNIRSIHNLGSIFRTAEGFGVGKIYLSGYTPSPNNGLPHVRAKIAESLHKTALGAEKLVSHEYVDDVKKLINELKNDGFIVLGLEQDPRAIMLPDLQSRLSSTQIPKGPTLRHNTKLTLLLGEEVHGIEPGLRDMCDELIEIPMLGQKESFNISVATGIALYELTK